MTFQIWYSFFVIAFAMGFYIMLHNDTGAPKDPKIEGEAEGDDEFPFFNQPWHALVKTTIMFVGEIEFGDLPIELSSWLSFLFLLSFVFLIIVVLMNLLNGLAVSDTGKLNVTSGTFSSMSVIVYIGIIREKAELVSHIARVDTVSYTESILLGDPLDFLGNWPPIKWISSLPSLALMRCLFRNTRFMEMVHKVTV